MSGDVSPADLSRGAPATKTEGSRSSKKAQGPARRAWQVACAPGQRRGLGPALLRPRCRARRPSGVVKLGPRPRPPHVELARGPARFRAESKRVFKVSSQGLDTMCSDHLELLWLQIRPKARSSQLSPTVRGRRRRRRLCCGRVEAGQGAWPAAPAVSSRGDSTAIAARHGRRCSRFLSTRKARQMPRQEAAPTRNSAY